MNESLKFGVLILFIGLTFILGCISTEVPKANLLINAEPVKSKVQAGSPVEVKLSIKNNGSYPINDVFIYINKLDIVKEVGNLNAGEEISLSVIGDSPKEKGNFYINVTGSFKDKYGKRYSHAKFKIETWLPALNVTRRISKLSEGDFLINISVKNLENVSVKELFLNIETPRGTVYPDVAKILRLDPRDTCGCEGRTDIKQVKFHVSKADKIEIVVSNMYGAPIYRETVNLT